MRSLARGVAALLALSELTPTQAFPSEKRSTFSILQGQRVRVARPPEAHYLRSLLKYQMALPDCIRTAPQGDKQQGSAPAVPEEFDAEYLTPITIGGQSMNVALDSGSADLWIFSSLLSPEMRGQHSFYTPGLGAKKLENQTWRIRYGDGTTASGDVYMDSVSLGGVTAPQQAVGAAQRVSDEFMKDANNDGIMGLGFKSLSSIKPNPQNSWFENVKKSLVKPLYTVLLKRNAPGRFDFGFIDKSRFSGELVWTRVNTTDGFWAVKAQSFQIGNLPPQNISIMGIVDTGTSLLITPPAMAKAYYAQVPGVRIGSRTGGYEFPCNATLPDFTLVINGYRATVPGDFVRYQPLEKGSPICFGGIQPGSDPVYSVFGDVFLKNQFVVFDTSGPKIGLARQAK